MNGLGTFMIAFAALVFAAGTAIRIRHMEDRDG